MTLAALRLGVSPFRGEKPHAKARRRKGTRTHRLMSANRRYLATICPMNEPENKLPEWPLWIARGAELLILLALATGWMTLISIAIGALLFDGVVMMYITWPSRYRKELARKQNARPESTP